MAKVSFDALPPLVLSGRTGFFDTLPLPFYTVAFGVRLPFLPACRFRWAAVDNSRRVAFAHGPLAVRAAHPMITMGMNRLRAACRFRWTAVDTK